MSNRRQRRANGSLQTGKFKISVRAPCQQETWQRTSELTTHKFYGGQKDGQREGENDTPEPPVLWHAIRDIVGRFGGG